MSFPLFPSVLPIHVWNKPQAFDAPDLRLYEQDKSGSILDQRSPFKTQIAKLEAVCGKILCAMLAVGSIGGIAFFAKVSIAPIVAQSFCVIAVACLVSFVTSKIFLERSKPSYVYFLESTAHRCLHNNDVSDAHSLIYALTQEKPSESFYKPFVNALLGHDFSADKRFKIIDELYIRLAIKYAEDNDYTMALDLIPRSGYCDSTLMEELLTRIKAIPRAPAIVQRLAYNRLDTLWHLRTNPESIPTAPQAYEMIYDDLATKLRGAFDRDPNTGDSYHIYIFNQYEKSKTVQALRFMEWKNLLREQFSQSQGKLLPEQLNSLR